MRQPDSQTAGQPDSQTARQQDSRTTRHGAAKHAYSLPGSVNVTAMRRRGAATCGRSRPQDTGRGPVADEDGSECGVCTVRRGTSRTSSLVCGSGPVPATPNQLHHLLAYTSTLLAAAAGHVAARERNDNASLIFCCTVGRPCRCPLPATVWSALLPGAPCRHLLRVDRVEI